MSLQRRKYDPDFKRNAVRLVEAPDRIVKEIAENLGISKDLLYKWHRELPLKEGLAFPSHGYLQQGTEMIYLFIKESRSTSPEKKICQALQFLRAAIIAG